MCALQLLVSLDHSCCVDVHILQLLFNESTKSKSAAKGKHAPSRLAVDYMEAKNTEHESEMKQQDESVDVIVSGLNNLYDSGVSIRNEIDDQKKDLSRMDKVCFPCCVCVCPCVCMSYEHVYLCVCAYVSGRHVYIFVYAYAPGGACLCP